MAFCNALPLTIVVVVVVVVVSAIAPVVVVVVVVVRAAPPTIVVVVVIVVVGAAIAWCGCINELSERRFNRPMKNILMLNLVIASQSALPASTSCKAFAEQ
jgi:hypothetical protein